MTHSNALRLQRLHVRRTPGIDDAFELRDLCEGVNLIHGPNACGKTSTAGAIEAVLWPSSTDAREHSVTASYECLGPTYLVSVDAGRLDVQCDGLPGKLPVLPSAEVRHRYRLSLHELLQSSDNAGQFAREIALASAGGFDLESASSALGFRRKPSGSSAASQRLELASRELREARQQQETLFAEASQLRELEERRTAAESAGSRAQLLELALQLTQRNRVLDAARQKLTTFPDLLASITGSEANDLELLRKQAEGAALREQAEVRRAEEADAEAAKALPKGEIAPELLHALQGWATQLSQAERSAADCERRVREAAAQLTVARAAIGQTVSDPQLSAVDAAGFGELAAFARDIEAFHAERDAVDAEARLAADDAADGAADGEQLLHGLRALALWLKESSAADDSDADKRRTQTIVVLCALGIAGWLLAGLWNRLAFLGIPAVVAAAWVLSRPKRSLGNDRTGRERDYLALGLPSPERWSEDRVTALIDTLSGALAAARLAERRAQWKQQVEDRRAGLAKRADVIEVRRATLEQQLGVAPSAEGRTLAFIADQVSHWRRAFQGLTGAEAEFEAAKAQRADAAAGFERVAESLGLGLAGAHAVDASAAVTGIKERVQVFIGQAEHAQSARARAAAAAIERASHRQRMLDITAVFGCTPDECEVVGQLCALHPDFVVAREAARGAAQEAESASALLRAHTLFDESVLSSSPDQIEQQRVDAAALASEHAGLVETCTDLRLRIGAAGKASRIEQALSEKTDAEAALQAIHRKDLAALIGDLLVRHVQRETRDQHRPAVFHRARELFATITRGRYCLEFRDQDADQPPTFRAIDSISGRGHALAELSAATRVQLLLAVRLAFVETQEQGLALPIVLDEALGTSDDVRASAVIDAVISLAEGGRQIFYFTAKHDEVRKWTQALETSRVSWKAFDLASIRAIDSAPPALVPAVLLPSVAPVLPGVVGHSHDSYGEALGVPGLRPGRQPTAATHLWYLFDDLQCLHECLRCGVQTWGQLETLIASGGMKFLAMYPKQFARARSLALAIESMHAESSIGISTPVDRALLIQSGAVSDRFMDPAVTLAASCDGDAARFLTALDARGIPGFQAKKIVDLRDFFETRGMLVSEQPRAIADIRLAMLAAVANNIDESLNPDDVDTLLTRIRQRVSGANTRLLALGELASPPGPSPRDHASLPA